jgi:hypothetical protein
MAKVEYEASSRFARISLNRPEGLNAIYGSSRHSPDGADEYRWKQAIARCDDGSSNRTTDAPFAGGAR